MPTNRFQPSFAAGVLGPGLHARIDIAKYDVGLKVGKNVFVHAHGGVSNRSGFEYICPVMDHTRKHRLIPFTRDDDENHVLLMGNLEMKIINNGGVVQSGGGDYIASTSYNSTRIHDVDYVQSIDVMYFAHPEIFPKEMKRLNLSNWTFDNLQINPDHAAPTGVTITPATSGSFTYRYTVSAIIDGEESFQATSEVTNAAADLNIAGSQNVISWSGTADEFNVYRASNGEFGYIGFTSDNSFTDKNIAPDLTQAPVSPAGIFNGAGNYPSCVTMFQQRLCWGNTENQPETIFMSQTGNFKNYTKHRILRDTDRIELDITGEMINRVRFMMQLRELLIFSSSGEFSVSGPNGVMLATNPIQTQYGYSGSARVKPLVVEDTALFVDRTGRSVRDLRYAFEQDGYTGNDLTIFASHYFENRTIEGWAFAKNPHSIVWVYLDDGTLLSFTYKREHQVWAWCEHDVGGEVESVAVIPEGGSDSLYIIVKRFINGADKRYVERLHRRDFDKDAPEDAFFLDSGLTYEGAPTQTISGLDHLEGETVSALADGNVIENLTVTGGQIAIQRSASKVHVGLPYVSEMENLPPAIDLDVVGAARGRAMKASQTFLQLEKTRGIEASTTTRDKWRKFTQTGGDLARNIPLFTGMISLGMFPDWNRDGTIVIRQRYPLPMTILGISPALSVGRSG